MCVANERVKKVQMAVEASGRTFRNSCNFQDLHNDSLCSLDCVSSQGSLEKEATTR